MARKYKRDSSGRFAGGGGGSAKSAPKAPKAGPKKAAAPKKSQAKQLVSAARKSKRSKKITFGEGLKRVAKSPQGKAAIGAVGVQLAAAAVLGTVAAKDFSAASKLKKQNDASAEYIKARRANMSAGRTARAATRGLPTMPSMSSRNRRGVYNVRSF